MTESPKSHRQVRREELRDALIGAGLDAHSEWPGTFTPPVALVGPNPDRYQTFDGAPYGRAIAGIAVTLISAAGVNDVMADEIERLCDVTYRTIAGLDEFLAGDLTTGNVEGYLAATIVVSCEVNDPGASAI